MAEISKGDWLKLAVEAFNKGQFQSKTACAKAFDVIPKTLINCLNRMTFCKETIANCWKLSDIEEDTLFRWILDMCQHGLPLQI